MREGECTFCKNDGKLYHIRGREACIKCQIEFLWDYAEGTRRLVEQGEMVWGPTPELLSLKEDVVMTDAEYYRLPKIIRDQLKKVSSQ